MSGENTGSIGKAKRIAGWDNPTIYKMKLMANTPDPGSYDTAGKHLNPSKSFRNEILAKEIRIVLGKPRQQKRESHILKDFYSASKTFSKVQTPGPGDYDILSALDRNLKEQNTQKRSRMFKQPEMPSRISQNSFESPRSQKVFSPDRPLI